MSKMTADSANSSTIYIATFSKYNNYGSRLQNFALCYAVRQLNGNPVTLRVTTPGERVATAVKRLLAILPNLHDRQRKWRAEFRKNKTFKTFNRTLSIKSLSYRRLRTLSGIGIAGSDQIWSPAHLTKNPRDADLFFLSFLPSSKRNAYAPSFGVRELPQNLKSWYAKHIDGFAHVSVREPQGQEIITELTGTSPPIMPDPTFLLSPEEWVTACNANQPPVPTHPYLVTYFLSNQGTELRESISSYAQAHNLDIINLAGIGTAPEEAAPGPDGFVSLVASAAAVVTDSFHGAVFSTIFETPFIIFRRTDVDQFSRVENLLNNYHLNSAIGNTSNLDLESVLSSIDFTQARQQLKDERTKGITYLSQILKSDRDQ